MRSTIEQHSINLPSAEVTLFQGLFTKPESDQLFNDLLTLIDWKHEAIKLFGKSVMQPRLTAYYGEKSYTYSSITMHPLPWTRSILQIKAKIEPLVNTQFNGVLLNLYRNGQDSMGWHSDDEKELVQDSVIASVSFGETRRFIFRKKDDHQTKLELKLGHGDFLVMGKNTQKFWQHQVPKSSKSSQPRINLTFRVLQ